MASTIKIHNPTLANTELLQYENSRKVAKPESRNGEQKIASKLDLTNIALEAKTSDSDISQNDSDMTPRQLWTKNVRPKSKKKVSFHSEKDLVKVVEISPRPVSPLAEELEPCDLDKLVLDQDVEPFSYGQYCLQKYLAKSPDTQSSAQIILPTRTDVYSRNNGRFFPKEVRQTHPRPMAARRSTSRTRELRGILTNGNESSYAIRSRPEQNLNKRQNETVKLSANSLIRERRILTTNGQDHNNKHKGGRGNLLTANSRSLNNGVELKISGESLTSNNNNRMHTSPYRQSSANFGRPLGSLRTDSSLSLTGNKPEWDRTRAAERRVQSASAVGVPTRKMYAWQVPIKGTNVEQSKQYVSHMWHMSSGHHAQKHCSETIYS